MLCPKCNKEAGFEPRIIKTKGMCDTCFDVSKGLIKVEDKPYYVPWSYRNDVEFNGTETPTTPEYFEEVNMAMPTVSWCKTYKKWKLHLPGADVGGYDVQLFDIYTLIQKKKSSN